MQVCRTVTETREILKCWRDSGEHIAFVPTMGNLHAGHLKLVETAQSVADRVVVSIFVNPTQFGPNEDFEAYPRTERDDCQQLASLGADAVFLPTVSDMYSAEAKTVISVRELSNIHCGVSRPGHFDGVATVVCKLFNIVQPDVAIFGKKDFQQLAIIRRMVADLDMPIEIRGLDTVRERSGLAMSSRNGYLSQEQRQIAPKLHESLSRAQAQVMAGLDSYEKIEKEAISYLEEFGFAVDYFSICRTDDLKQAVPGDNRIVILTAARLGKTRLIDNIDFEIAR